MKRILFFMLVGSMALFAYVDSDMDGVEDKKDQCPNTALTELVDIQGCSIKSLVNEHHYDIIFGVGYSQLDPSSTQKIDTLSGSVQVDYYYKDFSMQAITSVYNTDSDTSDSGMNDSIVAVYYGLHPSNGLAVRFGVGVILPTYDSSLDNEAADYLASVSGSYAVGQASLFAGYTYTIINDDNIDTADLTIDYQNTSALSVGAGYYVTSKLYASLSYNKSDSVYKKYLFEGTDYKLEDLESASVYAFYSLDASRFLTATYAKGLSDSASDHYFALRIGYYF